MLEIIKDIANWSNENQGVLTIVLFVTTIGLGWISGIFSTLRRKPKFRIKIIEGPTFTCTFGTGVKSGEYDIHRTGIALYLRVTNIGSAPASIVDVHIGYHWAIKPYGKLWWKYRIGWFWLCEQTICLTDFQVAIGNDIKYYPFLFQKSSISGSSSDTYLEDGKSTYGVVYFEQTDSFGARFPVARKNFACIKIRVIDSFERSYVVSTKIPRVSLEEARRFNPKFGLTISSIREEMEPIDLPVDKNGNLIPQST